MNNVVLNVLSNKYCGQCFLFKSRKHVFVRDETVRMNSRYVPSEIKVLFVAESPPWSFVKDAGYFYNPKGNVQYGGIGYFSMPILFRGRLFTRKQDFLMEFMGKQFYLIDMVKCPINKLSKAEKEEALKRCAKYLNEELHNLKFEKAIFIGKTSFNIVKKYITLDFNYDVIPFPSRSKRNIKGFCDGLKMALNFIL